MLARTALPRARGFVAIAGLCTVGVPLVWLFDRPRADTAGTVLALLAQASMAGALAFAERLTPSSALRLTRIAVLGLIGLLTAWTGYFFGPNGTFVAVLTLIFLLAGVLASPGTRDALGGWVVFATLAGSQAVVMTLIASRRVPDTPFTPVLLGDRPLRSPVLGHVFVQAIYLSAFVVGRGFSRRYRALSRELERQSRAEVVRDALLEEARAHYRHAVRLARMLGRIEAIPSEPPPPAAPTRAARSSGRDREPETVRLSSDGADTRTDMRASPEREPEPPPPPADEVPLTPEAWQEASRFRMRRVFRLTLGACVVGAVLLAVIARHRESLFVAWLGIAGIAAAIVVHNRSEAFGPKTWWAWTVGALFSVGPAYCVGLHSGFVGVVVTLLFVGDLFRAPIRDAAADKRHRVYLGTALSHATLFALVFTGVAPDLGNVPVLLPDAPPWLLVLQHVILQAFYLAAYSAGRLVDRRNATLMARSVEAARVAATQRENLEEAKKKLDALLAVDEAIFEGSDVGPYRVERLLGRGGMGDVYEAVHRERGEHVALKLIRRERADDPDALRSFAEEAQALGAVRSERVARVLDAGDESEELPYLAMELMRGPTLSRVLRRRERLPLSEVAVLVADVVAALRDCHDAGVLHLDLKPTNIARATDAPDEPWKLLDFGIAQLESFADRELIAGTPGYMAPEQALAASLDARADLYALCCVVYRALTGRPAFIGDDPVRLAMAAKGRPAPDPRWYVALPRDVMRVLRLGLCFDPERRFASAAELGAAFASACRDELSAHHRARADALLADSPWTEPEHISMPATSPEPPTDVGAGDAPATVAVDSSERERL